MKLFGTVFNSFYAGALDPILITDIFALHSWILINLKSILILGQSILMAKKMVGCYEMGLC